MSCCCLDPASPQLFSGSDDATVQVWNLDSKKCITVMKEHFSAVTSLALSEDGQTLLSAGRDKVVNVWDVHKYSSKKTIPTYEMVEAISFVGSGSGFLACLGVEPANLKGKTDGYFLTVGEGYVYSLWSLLPSCCNYPCDTASNFRVLQNVLCDTLQNQPDSCGIICSSIQVLHIAPV